jgi:cyclopropane fatty-acyl-phospholipid synthase-like methyltransferase
MREGDSLLDIGCGESGIIENYAVKAGCRLIVAIDIQLSSLVKAKMRCSGNIEFALASATYLPFKDGVFDKVAMIEVLEHLPKQSEGLALIDVYRVLKSGGDFVLSTPHKRFLYVLLDPAFFLMGHRHYDVDEIHHEIRKANFTLGNIFTYGGIREAVLTPIFYLLRKMKICDHRMPSIFSKQVDKEYSFPRRGGYTIIVDCNKSAPQ